MKKIGKKSFLFNMYPSDGEVIAMAAIVLSVLENKVKKKKCKRKLWMKPRLQKRHQLVLLNTLMQEIKLQDQEGCKNLIFAREIFQRLSSAC